MKSVDKIIKYMLSGKVLTRLYCLLKGKYVCLNGNSVVAAFLKVDVGSFPQDSVWAGSPTSLLPLSIE